MSARDQPEEPDMVCYGRMADGSLRRVVLEENLFTQRGHRQLVALAKATGRFIPGLLDDISIY